MNDQANAYLKARVMSASREELRLMLIEGAIRFARMAVDGLKANDYEVSFNGIHQCQAILLELTNSLRPEHAPKLCERLAALYTYMYRRLMDASTTRELEPAEEVVELLEYECESWKLLMAQLVQERQSAAHPETPGAPAPSHAVDGTPSHAPAANPPGPPASSDMIGSTLSVEG